MVQRNIWRKRNLKKKKRRTNMNQTNISSNSTPSHPKILSGPAFRPNLPTYKETCLWLPLFIAEGVLIITANCLSILVFTSKKYRKKKSSLLLANLAVADLLVGCLATSLQVYTLGATWFWEFELPMALNVPLDLFTGFCSLFSLTVIAFERLFATWHPIRYKLMKTRIYVIVIAVTWSLAALVPCAVYLIPPDVLSRMALNYMIASLLCLSVFLIIFSYTAIGIKMSPRNNQLDQRQQRQSHVIKTLTLVTFLSLVSWLPFQVIILAFYISKGRFRFSLTVIELTKFLQFGNSFVNSIVYYLRMPGFRSDLKRMLCSRIPRMPCTPQDEANIQARGENNEFKESRDNENGERGCKNVASSSFVATNSTVFTEETKF